MEEERDKESDHTRRKLAVAGWSVVGCLWACEYSCVACVHAHGVWRVGV
jgi:predicted metal-binding protein